MIRPTIPALTLLAIGTLYKLALMKAFTTSGFYKWQEDANSMRAIAH